ncbi:MAG: ABC transporter permease [Deltaproteobacteria bacterium]|nr:ABC transporter permease [Deltaproteobacteria bacterium]
MRKVWAITLNTFREAIRNKVLYSLLFFAVLVIVASRAFGALSVNEEVRLTVDLGLAGMSLFLVIIAIFIGVNLVYKELERKTVYTLLPKPIHRYQFVLGKFLGLTLTLFIQTLVMAFVLAAVLWSQGAEVSGPIVRLMVLIFFEVVVVTAIAVFFSSFSTPFLSGMFTIGIFLLGRSVPDIRAVAAKITQPLLSSLLEGVSAIVPNLRYYFVTGADIKGQHVSVNGTFVDWGYVGTAAGYASIYTALVLLFAMALFSRRDFI